MNSFDIDPVKAQKVMAIRRFRRIQKIAGVFRCVEVFVVLVFLTWLSLHLPIAIRISGDFFRQLLVVAVSPRFVFVVGNAIIITLVLKSGQFSTKDRADISSSGGTDLYEEFVKNSESRAKVRSDEIEYQDKAVCVETRYSDTASRTCTEQKRNFQRCRSERMAEPEKMRPELRRAETDPRLKVERLGRSASRLDIEMSNEEFRRTVEAFIAKQQKFQREEETMAIVLHDHQ